MCYHCFDYEYDPPPPWWAFVLSGLIGLGVIWFLLTALK